MPIRHSAALTIRIELVLPALNALARRLWSAPDLRRLYPAYLGVLHQTIRATVPVMEVAIEQARRRAADDPVARGLLGYLEKHLPEERGHDEWVRQDLAAIGVDPDPVCESMPPPAVASLVGAQYYWIRHHHPVCLLGHIAVLEGYPPSPELATHIMARTGYPKSGLRTLIRHAALDVRHRDGLHAAIDALPLTPAHLSVMGLSAVHTVRAAVDVFAELLDGRGPDATGADTAVAAGVG